MIKRIKVALAVIALLLMILLIPVLGIVWVITGWGFFRISDWLMDYIDAND